MSLHYILDLIEIIIIIIIIIIIVIIIIVRSSPLHLFALPYLTKNYSSRDG